MNIRNFLAMAGMMLALGSDADAFYQSEPKPKVRFSDKSKALFGEPHRELKQFSIKGHKVMAYSKKDAITRLKYLKKI